MTGVARKREYGAARVCVAFPVLARPSPLQRRAHAVLFVLRELGCLPDCCGHTRARAIFCFVFFVSVQVVQGCACVSRGSGSASGWGGVSSARARAEGSLGGVNIIAQFCVFSWLLYVMTALDNRCVWRLCIPKYVLADACFGGISVRQVGLCLLIFGAWRGVTVMMQTLPHYHINNSSSWPAIKHI